VGQALVCKTYSLNLAFIWRKVDTLSEGFVFTRKAPERCILQKSALNIPASPPDRAVSTLLAWHQQKEQELINDTGWLTLVGLFPLHRGDNRVGSDATADVVLPSVPAEVGTLTLDGDTVTFRASKTLTTLIVEVGGLAAREAVLKHDMHPDGPTLITINTVTFFLLKRGESYLIRVRDRNSLARKTFGGRHWFDFDPVYRVQARYIPHAVPRQLSIVTSTGLVTPMDNIGYVEFTLDNRPLRLEAFSENANELWFIFKDQTSGTQTYGMGRFLKTALAGDQPIDLDFNRAYSPPCAFTHYATCPMPSKENTLPVAILAGEKHSPEHS
jgi:uncharacterized protein (DUF1684 family)